MKLPQYLPETRGESALSVYSQRAEIKKRVSASFKWVRVLEGRFH
jgi:DNA primase